MLLESKLDNGIACSTFPAPSWPHFRSGGWYGSFSVVTSGETWGLFVRNMVSLLGSSCGVLSHLLLLGLVVRVAPNSIVTSDLEAIRRIWGVRSQYQRSNYYEAFRPDPMHHDIHSVVDDAIHTQLKTKMSAGVQLTFPLYVYLINGVIVFRQRNRTS